MTHTYEECYEVAKKYEYQNDFIRDDPAVYYYAYRRGWIKDYVWIKFRRHKNITVDECVEAALKCNSVQEFRSKYMSLYRYASTNGLLKDFVWLDNDNAWSYDEVVEISKKYRRRNDFAKEDANAYHAALVNGWLNDFHWLDKDGIDYADKKFGKTYIVYGYFDHDNMKCIILITRDRNFRKYKKRNKTLSRYFVSVGKEFQEPEVLYTGLLASKAVSKRDMLMKFYESNGYSMIKYPNVSPLVFLPKKKIRWTHDACYEEAMKYTLYSDFRSKSRQAYRVSRKNGWTDEYTWLDRSQQKHKSILPCATLDEITTYEGAFFSGGEVVLGPGYV